MITLQKSPFAALRQAHENDAGMVYKLSISFLFDEIETVFHRHQCDRVMFCL
ncbi:hypothetical protein [Paraburkholderia silvatlantica]|uniref:hypothetical protein n=1 Tax=Paraburkholderia silvatlantica TaxID=321895 RepID=UPI003753C5FA